MTQKMCPILSMASVTINERIDGNAKKVQATGFVPCIREQCQLWKIGDCGLKRS